MTLAGQQGPAAGGHAVSIRRQPGKLGKPERRGFGHFALRHFPDILNGYGISRFLPLMAAGFQSPDALLLAQRGRQRRPRPGQQTRGRQTRFPPVGQQKPQLAPVFFHDKGDLNRISFQILHHASGGGILHQCRHSHSLGHTIRHFAAAGKRTEKPAGRAFDATRKSPYIICFRMSLTGGST